MGHVELGMINIVENWHHLLPADKEMTADKKCSLYMQ